MEMGNQVMAPVDFQSRPAAGIKLYLERGVERFAKATGSVFFSTGESIATDMVLLSIRGSSGNDVARPPDEEIGETD